MHATLTFVLIESLLRCVEHLIFNDPQLRTLAHPLLTIFFRTLFLRHLTRQRVPDILTLPPRPPSDVFWRSQEVDDIGMPPIRLLRPMIFRDALAVQFLDDPSDGLLFVDKPAEDPTHSFRLSGIDKIDHPRLGIPPPPDHHSVRGGL